MLSKRKCGKEKVKTPMRKMYRRKNKYKNNTRKKKGEVVRGTKKKKNKKISRIGRM